ncbi:MAG TPA: hypothetical protein VF649_07790 [Sphingomonas sp.]|jgi:hypothetical protein|uniref:hypothetical protein n=1 Tax=Sphingomonas sp. TaxID=28214 RepID=UPI002ED932A4
MFAAVTGFLLMLQPVPAAPPALSTTPPSEIPAAIAAAGLPPLAGDAFRFTDVSPGGRDATLFDARRTASGTERTIIGLSRTQSGWEVTSRDSHRLAGETFDYLSKRIETAIATPPPAAGSCPDGSDYRSERAQAGVIRALAGCGEGHPNVMLARLFGVRDTP